MEFSDKKLSRLRYCFLMLWKILQEIKSKNDEYLRCLSEARRSSIILRKSIANGSHLRYSYYSD